MSRYHLAIAASLLVGYVVYQQQLSAATTAGAVAGGTAGVVTGAAAGAALFWLLL